jgi:hypothetical protein
MRQQRRKDIRERLYPFKHWSTINCDWEISYEVRFDFVFVVDPGGSCILDDRFLLPGANYQRVALLWMLSIPEWMQNRGIGTQMVDLLEKRANAQGHRFAAGPFVGETNALPLIMIKKKGYRSVMPFSAIQISVEWLARDLAIKTELSRKDSQDRA